MHVQKWKHHAVFDSVYTREPDVLVETFASTVKEEIFVGK